MLCELLIRSASLMVLASGDALAVCWRSSSFLVARLPSSGLLTSVKSLTNSATRGEKAIRIFMFVTGVSSTTSWRTAAARTLWVVGNRVYKAHNLDWVVYIWLARVLTGLFCVRLCREPNRSFYHNVHSSSKIGGLSRTRTEDRRGYEPGALTN